MSAHALFKRAVEEHGGAVKVSKLLGVSRGFVYMLSDEGSDKRPGLDLAVKIQRELGVPAWVWVPRPGDATPQELAADTAEETVAKPAKAVG